MEYFSKKIILLIMTFIMSFTLNGCINKNEDESEKVEIPHYSDVIAIENNENGSELYNINNYQLSENGSIDDMTQLVYNTQKSVYVYLVNLAKEGQLRNNKMIIVYNGIKSEVKDFFTAMDIELNSSGDKIAYRTFKSNSLDSAQGMRIYDLKDKKYVKLNSKVLVSGNLYKWLDDHRIIYYGSIEGKKDSDKIYMYDFNTHKEQVYLNDTEGYCMYFTSAGNNLLFLSRAGESLYLYYYECKSNQIKLLSNDFTGIYDSISDDKSGNIFFFASIGKDETALYKFNINDNKLERITYDFPQNIKISAGISKDEKGNIYFIGVGNEQNSGDVFMYDIDKKSINIISDHEGNYSIYGDRGKVIFN
ncbi:hypothetical protein ACJDU8_15090 [Clostridium sp. WILCCON 0269]|uniref:Peptidase S9A N-terminal domain-containing protein n=1 Tax=Candidatus Clostridium eludens TaxID=3381663 RepID=A0ABW8SLR7_9CLOT